MIGLLKTLFEMAVWIAAFGIPFGLLIPVPEMTPQIGLGTWMLFLGSVLTVAVRPAATRIKVMFKNIKTKLQILNVALLRDKEQAKAVGINSPLDYCVYMATCQIATKYYIGDAPPTFYAVTGGGFGVTQDKLFREMYGRAPLSSYDASAKYYILLRNAGLTVRCESMRDMWIFCVKREAARLTGIPEDALTFDVIKNAVSENLRQYVFMLADLWPIRQARTRSETEQTNAVANATQNN